MGLSTANGTTDPLPQPTLDRDTDCYAAAILRTSKSTDYDFASTGTVPGDRTGTAPH